MLRYINATNATKELLIGFSPKFWINKAKNTIPELKLFKISVLDKEIGKKPVFSLWKLIQHRENYGYTLNFVWFIAEKASPK